MVMMNSKIKIAFFAESLLENIDGAVRTMYQLINRIPEDTFEFLFITGEGPEGPFPHEIMLVPSIKLPFNPTYKMTLSFLHKKQIEQKLNTFEPAVIHIATPSPMGHFASKYAEARNLPVISIYHTHFLSYLDYYLRHVKFLLPAARNRLIGDMQTFYNACDLVYVPTNRMSEDLCQMGVFSNHLKLWQRGLKTGLFSPNKRDLHYIHSLSGNRYQNILFASRLVWEKNLKTLERVYEQIKQMGLPYNFIIAGEGAAKENLQQSMPEAHFLGHVDHEELSKLYASADVFLFPSISETYGNVLIEAMASGLPCVIGNGGGTTDLVTHKWNGLICQPNDERQYVEAIQLVLHNELLRKSIVNKGLGYVKDLSWDKLVDTYFSDLSRLATKRFAKSA